MKQLLLRLHLVAVTALLIVILSGETSAKTGNETAFLKMLRRVPDTPEFRRTVLFSDIEAIKQSFGQAGINLYEKIYVEGSIPAQADINTKEGLFADLIQAGGAGFYRTDAPGQLHDTLGFSHLEVSRGILAGAPSGRSVGVVDGIPDMARVTRALETLKYDTASYEGATYYTRYGDYEVSLGDPLSRYMMANMNRVAVYDKTLVYAPSTAMLKAALDTIGGRQKPLAENPRYQALGREMGGIVTEALYTPEFGSRDELLGRLGLDHLIPSDKAALQSYLGDPIPLPSLVAIGIRLQEEQERVMVLALHYESEAEATQAREAIGRRVASGAFSIAAGRTSLADRWTVLGSRITKAETGSLVIFDLKLKDGVSSRLWLQMMMYRDLDLLIS